MNILTFILALAMLPAAWAAPTPQTLSEGSSQDRQSASLTPRDLERIAQETRRRLVMLPYYGVFDNLEYKVDPDGTVTLLGQVRKPVLKSDAENAVKKIEGVPKVVNDIQVLPLSNFDDRIRLHEYRAIYSSAALFNYATLAVPPIHIIVDNGHVTLVGVVDNSMDKQIAYQRASTVPGVFSVKNELRVEGNSQNDSNKKK